MASGFQTSDGVDLDSRYLGINAKAKSAAMADTATKATTATTANSVAWSGVSGRPSLALKLPTGEQVTAQVSQKAWVASINCFADEIKVHVSGSGIVYLDGVKLGGVTNETVTFGPAFLPKGATISCSGGTYSITVKYTPYSIV